MSVTAEQQGSGVVAKGPVSISSLFGAFRGVAHAQAVSVETTVLDDGSVESVVRTGRFSYSDLTNWVPGYSAGIKYYWAVAEVTVIAGQVNAAGFKIVGADDGILIASVPVSPLVLGSIPIK
jgi:hypothetical protein